MRLKKLEIHGFKSFADRTEVVFHQGITGIVGPNGSGKSNIGDAVRWVLGEQSARVLRGSKMEDIIFNGTAKRKPASFCEVSLVFDNEDGALKVNFAEVMVTRRVYRNGDSEYYLNKNACRLKDIVELFRDTGIGREGYSLIGQGRVDEILSSKSEDRRQIFEEAAGVVTYRVRKEEAERKLERTRDNLSRVSDILEELADRVGPLEKQAATARRYLELSERLKTLEVNIYLSRYDRLKERITALDQTMEGLKDILLQHEARLNENAAERQELEEAISLLEQELTVARQQLMDTSDALHDQQTKRDHTALQIQTAQDNLLRIQREITETEQKKNDLNQLAAQGAENAEESGKELEEAHTALTAAQQTLESHVAETQEKEETLNRHNAEVLRAVNQLSDARNQQARQQAIHAQMTSRLAEIQAQRQSQTEQQAQIDTRLEEAQQLAAAAKNHLEEMRQAAASNEEQLQMLTLRTQETAEQSQRLNLQCQSDASRLKTLEEMSQEMEGYNQSVRKALAFAQSDPSVRGVLARLMQVPQHLETAIDMVLGGTLQNIVTENEDSAKRIINYLRTQRLGRATFLPMTTVKSRTLTAEERRLLSMPGCLGVASELISFEPQYRGIMENLLGRTIIATDLDSGIPIMRAGHHAFRLVTLTGDVMHSGGSMTGGTAQKSSVSLLGREREVKELRAQVEAQQKELADLRAKLTDLQTRREECKRVRNASMEQIHQEEIAVAREQEHVANIENQRADWKQQLIRTREAETQLTESIREIEQDLQSIESRAESVSFDRESMDRQTELLQQQLAQSREQTEKQRELVTKLQLHYAELTHQMDTLQRDKNRQEQELQTLARTSARLDKEKLEVESALKAHKAQLETIEAACAEQEKALAGCQGEVARLEALRQEKTNRQRDCMNLNDSIHQELEADTAKLHRLELSRDRADSDIKSMTEHIFNTYELTYAGAAEMRLPEPFDLGGSEREAAALRTEIRDLGPINVSAIEEYAENKERFDELTAQKNDMAKAEEDLQVLIARLLSQMEKLFVSEFEKIAVYFQETFTRLFGGGQAELRLTDPNDALNCGIDIIAQPPGKKLQLMSLLSGGERALTAIAILFAMLKLKPTPFCILDEIEAALDEANIGYFADYLSEYAATTQFIVVTHRKGTMERCDALYGVAMQERGVSGIVSVNLQDYE